MIKVSRILLATGRIEEKYSREDIEQELENYILEVLAAPKPVKEFKSYVQQNFGKAYHLFDDFVLDEGLWQAAIKKLQQQGKLRQETVFVPVP